MNTSQKEKLNREHEIVRNSKTEMFRIFATYGRDSIEGTEARRNFKTDEKVYKALRFKFGLDK